MITRIPREDSFASPFWRQLGAFNPRGRLADDFKERKRESDFGMSGFWKRVTGSGPRVSKPENGRNPHPESRTAKDETWFPNGNRRSRTPGFGALVSGSELPGFVRRCRRPSVPGDREATDAANRDRRENLERISNFRTKSKSSLNPRRAEPPSPPRAPQGASSGF